jgi:hypothetical protein
VAFEALLRRLSDIAPEPGPLVWRRNLGLRGLEALPVTFKSVNSVNSKIGASLCDLRPCA